jgi:hypothetical protein
MPARYVISVDVLFSALPRPSRSGIQAEFVNPGSDTWQSYAGANRFPSNYGGIIVTSEWLIAASAEQAMDRLTAKYQTLLRLLTCGLDLSYSGVAGPMGLPIGSINPMRIRAIRMLYRREWSIWVRLAS